MSSKRIPFLRRFLLSVTKSLYGIKRGWVRTLVIAVSIIVFILILFFLLVYLASIIFPNKIRDIVVYNINTLIKETNAAVVLDDVRIVPFKGVGIKNLKIYRRGLEKRGPLLEAGEIYFNYLPLPIFRKNFIIPFLHINNLKILVENDPATGKWNIAALKSFKKSDSATPQKKRSVIIYLIKVTNGSLGFRDNLASPALSANIEDIKANFTLNPQQLKFSINGFTDKSQSGLSPVRIEGLYKYANKELESKLHTENIPIQAFQAYYRDKLPLKVKEALATKLDLDIKLKNEKELSVKGNYNISDTELEYNDLKGGGDISGVIDLNINLASFPDELSYAINASPKSFYIEGLSYVDSIKGITGDILFTPAKISTNNLKGRLGGDFFSLKGDFLNLENPIINAEVSSNTSLAKTQPLIKKLLARRIESNFELGGGADLFATLSYPLNEPSKMAFSVSASLKDASIKADKLPQEIKNINGMLKIEDDLVVAKHLDFDIANQTYNLNGTWKNFKRPEVDIDLKSNKLSAITIFDIEEGTAYIERADITYNRLSGSFAGEIYNIYNPDMNLYGDVEFSLTDVEHVFLEKTEFFKDKDLSGICKGKMLIKGRPHDLKNFEVGLKVQSEKIMIGDFKAQDFDINAVLKDKKLDIKGLSLTYYGGTLDAIGTIDLTLDNMPYESTLHFRGIKIKELIQNTKFKAAGVYGNLNSSINVAGSGKTLDSLKGAGWIRIKEANLGPLPFFKPMIRYLFDFLQKTVSGTDRITLKEASGTFTIDRGRIATDDFILWGDTASVLFDGYIDIEGNLNFRIENNLVEGLVDDKTDMGKTLSTLATQIGSLIGEAYLTGTIDEPKYELKGFSGETFFKQKLKDLIQDIAQ